MGGAGVTDREDMEIDLVCAEADRVIGTAVDDVVVVFRLGLCIGTGDVGGGVGVGEVEDGRDSEAGDPGRIDARVFSRLTSVRRFWHSCDFWAYKFRY